MNDTSAGEEHRPTSGPAPSGPRPPEPSSFSTALRTAITRRRLSLRALQQQLAARGHSVSVAALSMWQSGSRSPEHPGSIAALPALEEILGLDTGALSNELVHPRFPGRPMRFLTLDEDLPQREVLERMMRELGFTDPMDQPHEMSVVERAVLDSAQEQLRIDIHLIVRALKAGPCMMPSIHMFAEDEPVIRPEIIPVGGCRIGEAIDWPQQRVFGAQVIIDDDLHPGDLASCHFRVILSTPPHQVPEVLYSVARRAKQVLLEVQFEEHDWPDQVEQLRGEKDTDVQVRPAMVNASMRARTFATDYGPGMVGLRWRWPD
ncbi:hypothetical protein M3A96_11115 [Helcobacillus massiliensis]|uniref:hypothetical protein n=1 Tax=Helcobacillus TaxID=1161125 RepID=UPI001EF6C57C|nr:MULTISPECIES: hypothetical protein [Helcobacillus]MCG7426083.1 hypothetical protein [Helcobacillus sp. ACRRO]MCT1558658.1 hypothetical protein [Helcobacillus massiliensis]MCT2037242.1 hypothetical protein [Helcobacillus massiliensis]MCT2332880.1 hypothetical protein [Helcobacillus massiliensis]